MRVSRHRSMVTLDTQFQTPGTKRLQNISGSFSLSSYIFIHNWFNTKECSLVLFAALTIYSEKQNKKRLRFVDKFSGTFLQIPHTSDIYLSFFDSLHSLWQSLEPREQKNLRKSRYMYMTTDSLSHTAEQTQYSKSTILQWKKISITYSSMVFYWSTQSLCPGEL